MASITNVTSVKMCEYIEKEYAYYLFYRLYIVDNCPLSYIPASMNAYLLTYLLLLILILILILTHTHTYAHKVTNMIQSAKTCKWCEVVTGGVIRSKYA